MEIRILHDVYWSTKDGLSGIDPTRVCLYENGQYMEVALDTKDEQQIQGSIDKIKEHFLKRIGEQK